jgi:hypothetical protein
MKDDGKVLGVSFIVSLLFYFSILVVDLFNTQMSMEKLNNSTPNFTKYSFPTTYLESFIYCPSNTLVIESESYLACGC